MPEERPPDILENVDLETEPFKFGGQTIEDKYALKLAQDTFDRYENYRTNNHDPRWNGADALYCAYQAPKNWEGTRIPKAALSNPVVFSHVETMLPIIEQAVFGTDLDWFQVAPEPGGDPAEAEAIKNHILYLLEHDHDDFGKTARREIGLALKSLLIYGNGGIKAYWNPSTKKPCVEWVDIRDLYIDPGCTTPDIEDGDATIQRCHFTVEELNGMRDSPGMNIPPPEVLSYFSRHYSNAPADRTKSVQEAFRGVNYTPGSSDYAAMPSDRLVEVLIYTSKSRIIWNIGREWVAFNGVNPYRFQPFCFAPCYTFLGRFYALSLADVLGDAQVYISGLYNARLNELSLSINPPKISKAGAVMTPSQERWHPGANFKTANPKEDFVFPTMSNATQNIMGDIEYMLSTTERIDGANGIVSGTPRGGNVNRTATGVSSQSQGGSSRLYYIVKNIEDYLIVPLLYKIYKLIQFHTDASTLLPALGPDDQKIEVGAGAFQKPIRFQMISASRMLTKDKLMSIMPFLSQYFMNGSFLQQLHGVNKTVDFDVMQQLIQDASGTGRMYKLVRTMTDQEKQALNQPPPQAVAQQKAESDKLQSQQQIEDKKNQTSIQVAQIAHASDAQQANLDAQKAQAEMAQTAQKSNQENHQKVVQMTLEQQRKHAEAAQKQQVELAKTKLDLHSKAADIAMTQKEHEMKMAQDAQEHSQKMVQMEKENAQKLEMQHLMMALKAQAAMQPPQSDTSNN